MATSGGKSSRLLLITGDFKISREEFHPKWQEASGFCDYDTLALFRHFALESDPEDPGHITELNVRGIWEMIFFAGNELNISGKCGHFLLFLTLN